MSKPFYFFEKQSCLLSLLWDRCVSGELQQWCRNFPFLIIVRCEGTGELQHFFNSYDDFLIVEIFSRNITRNGFSSLVSWQKVGMCRKPFRCMSKGVLQILTEVVNQLIRKLIGATTNV